MKVLFAGNHAVYKVSTDNEELVLQVDTAFNNRIDIYKDEMWKAVDAPVLSMSDKLKELVHFAKEQAGRELDEPTASEVLHKLEVMFPNERRSIGHSLYKAGREWP